MILFGYFPKKKEELMDLMILAAVAILLAVFSALVAIFTKKTKWKVLIYALVGLMAGIPIGYALAPFVLSFY